jgi:endonuclease-3
LAQPVAKKIRASRRAPEATRRRAAKTRESRAKRTARAARIVEQLHALYPVADCALRHDSALQLLAATILSAQCTDDRVNIVTKALFARYKTAEDFATANQAALEKVIQSTGFFRNKARNLIGMGRVLCERFNGDVPATMEELLELPGVARKTANVVLGTWFGRNEGMVVDTHIGRLATRLGLTWNAKDDKDAVKIERDLMQVLPREEWTYVGHALIFHGRRVCAARKPDCARCALADACPSAFSFNNDQPRTARKTKNPK